MALQNEKADAKLAVRVIKFLNHLASREAVLCNPIRDVLSKWVDGNAIVNAIFNNNGGFFDEVCQIALSPTLSNQQPSEDHVYVSSEILYYKMCLTLWNFWKISDPLVSTLKGCFHFVVWVKISFKTDSHPKMILSMYFWIKTSIFWSNFHYWVGWVCCVELYRTFCTHFCFWLWYTITFSWWWN